MAKEVVSGFKSAGFRVLLLDGDCVRENRNERLGFSRADVKKNNRYIANLCVEKSASYDMVFVAPLRRRLKAGDMIVAISSSGSSPNVLKAADFAASQKATVVTLSAMQPDNALRQLGALNFWLPAETYGMAETGHAAILHHWMDRVSLTGQGMEA